MASSAVYRYVASRDDLLTRLIVQSYDELGEHVEQAEAAVARADLRDRWFTVGHATRRWALAHPYDWALLYGSPVPGYAAPAQQTIGPGTRVQVVLMRLLADMVAQGQGAPSQRRPRPVPVLVEFGAGVGEALGVEPDGVPADLAVAGVTAWMMLIGAVNSEVFGYLGEGGEDAEAVGAALFDYTISAAVALLLR